MRVKEVRETNLNYTKFTNLQSEEPKVNITELNARLNKIKKENLSHYENFLDAVNDDKIMLIIKNKYEWPKDISKEIIDLLEDFIKSEGFRK